MSSLLPYPELAPRGPDAMLRELETYEPSWGEYLSAAAGEGWWASVPGQAEARLKAPDVLPDDTQLEVRSRMSGVPVEQIRANMARAEQPVEPSPLLSREEFEAGDWKREGLDWDPRMTESRARAMAQVFDENEYRRWVLSRDVSAGKQVAGFLTQIAVGFTDPVNYIPVFGPAARAAAAARFGRVAGTAAVHSAEAALTTAAVQPLLLPSRQAFGDDVGFADAVMDVGFSALFGAAVGAGAGAWARWRGDPLVHDVGVQRTAAETLAAAADDVARGAAPDLKAAVPLLSPDAQKLRDAIRQIEANPVGDPLSPMVPLTTHDMQQVIVARGGFRNINSMEISKRGWGLVKVIWKHGWQSDEPDHLKVTEDDVLAFPEIIQTMRPTGVDPSARPDGSAPDSLTWVIERDSPYGKRRILYGTNTTRHHENQMLVTVYVVSPDDQRYSLPLSEKAVGETPASHSEAGNPPVDTAVASSQSGSRGQIGSPTEDTIPPSGVEFTPNVMGRANLSPERAEALPDVDAAVPLLSPDAQKLRDAIRQIEANPVGDPLSPMVPLTTHDMQEVIVARGGFKNINSMEISKRGWGLVKVIWKHGWQSNEPDHLKVTEDDVLAFPEIIQTMRPTGVDPSARPDDPAPDSLTWVIERDSPYGKRRILYGTNTTRHHENQMLVTVYAVRPDDAKYNVPLSEKAVGETPASHSEAGNPPVDTAVASVHPDSRGQIGSPTKDTIPPSGVEFTPNVMGRADLSPERAEALPDVDAVAADVLRPATPADLAAEMGLDLTTGLFDGVERFRQLEAEGRITAEEAAEIRAAEEMMGKADKYAKAFEAAAICMGSRV